MGPSHPRFRIACAVAAAWLLLPASTAVAQTSPFALDAVAMVDVDRGSQVVRNSIAWFDVFGAARIKGGLEFRARPVVFRRSFDGKWQAQMYELALRYERPGPVGWRVDVGQFASPIGLSILENRPNLNPVISQHSTLYLPLPRYEAGTPTQFLLAAAYPFGGQFTVAGSKWDARAAIVDSSPVRGRPFFGANKPPRMMNVVAGGGVTPRIGLRLGASFAQGPFAKQTEVRDPSKGDREATLAQVEGEWSFGYTRLAGEWLWTWREAAIDEARAHGGWIEVTQTLTPRIFSAVRYDDQRTWWTEAGGRGRVEDYRRVEATLGYRLTRDVTLRASYLTRKGYVVFFWDDQVLASVVFARKLK
ncbi:MAG: hypothetical protein ABI665_16770 [Vicinamibacterales bacterium]